MNKKAEMGLVGGMIITFVAIIVGLAIFNGGITSNVAATTTIESINTSLGDGGTIAITLGSDTNLVGKLITNFAPVNATGGVPAAGNYTISNNVLLADGSLGATITNASTTIEAGPWNVSYDYQPVGYITSSGGRSLTTLIIIFSALAIAVAAIAGAMGSMKGMFD